MADRDRTSEEIRDWIGKLNGIHRWDEQIKYELKSVLSRIDDFRDNTLDKIEGLGFKVFTLGVLAVNFPSLRDKIWTAMKSNKYHIDDETLFYMICCLGEGVVARECWVMYRDSGGWHNNYGAIVYRSKDAFVRKEAFELFIKNKKNIDIWKLTEIIDSCEDFRSKACLVFLELKKTGANIPDNCMRRFSRFAETDN